MSTPMQIVRVTDVEIEISKSDPPKLTVRANGEASTPQWIDTQLLKVDSVVPIPKGGILELNLVAIPPMGNQVQIVTPVPEATYKIDPIPTWLTAVKVNATSNFKEKVVPLS